MELIIEGRLLQCLFFIACCVTSFSTGFIFDENGLVQPNDPFVFIDEYLTLNCTLTAQNLYENSASMYFTKRNRKTGEDVPFPQKYIRIVNTRTISLQYPVQSAEDGGNYVCQINRTGNSPMILGNQVVMVDYHPKAVEKIDCHVFNWKNMTCSWDLGVDYVSMNHTKVSLVWAIISQYDCPHLTKTSCTWHADDGNNTFRPDLQYYMVVFVTKTKRNGQKVAEEKSKTFTILTSNLVEPAKVENLKVQKKNSTCVTLSWNHKNVNRKKIYRVQYRSNWDRNVWMEQNGKEEYVTICNLIPATDYFFKVSCKPIPPGETEPKGFWSKWEVITDKTDEDVPALAPQMNVGSYMELSCGEVDDNCRNVQIYWQQVELRYSHGRITGYLVEYASLETGATRRKEQPSGDQNSLVLRLKKSESYIVHLWAETVKGTSLKYSQIRIPRSGKGIRPAFPERFVVEAVNTLANPYFKLSWKNPASSKVRDNSSKKIGYTLFWCSRMDFSFMCRDNINWTILPPDQYTFEFYSSVGLSESNYQFGISVESEGVDGQPVSSGIMWNQCIYIKDQRPSHPPKNVRFSDYQPDQSLSIVWDRLDCQESSGYITHYNLQYCVGDINKCAGAVFNKSIDNNKESHLIQDLDSGTTYRVVLQAVSKAGPGPKSKPIARKVIDSSLKAGAVVGICFGGLFVLILLMFSVIVICKRLKKQKIRYPVSFPESVNDLNSQKSGKDSRHIQERPLPDIPPLGTAVLDDGYSSGGTNPDARYERVLNRNSEQQEDNRNSRNISISSETSLLGHMEDNSHDTYNVSGGKNVQPPCSDTASGGDATKIPEDKIEKVSKSDKLMPVVKTKDQDEDNSGTSYSKFDLFDRKDAECNEKSMDHVLNDSKTFIPCMQTSQIGFILRSPPPDTPPPPPPPPPPTSAATPCSGLDYVPFKTAGSDGPKDSDVSGGEESSFRDGYVSHDQGVGNQHSSPSSSAGASSNDIRAESSGLSIGHAVIRPLSEYMKDLPLHYFEDPQQNHQFGPTTEL